MDYKIIWSPDALDDIEAIAKYISRDSEFYAESTVLKIYEVPQSLVNFPKRGRVVPEIGNENIREIFSFQYRIIYEIKCNEIHILTVIYGKQLLDKNQI
ncbi:MAG: type II toxin-antitoxin system RelE/ParE family toxin [Candidatus Scalindua sp.]|nr:type II toxin-antitoxin system RelE/ParE family toxin [Candidatus Scalindua sp.]